MKKYVLTGGPSSGKSSILLALEYRGEQVVREAAEDVIRLEQARGIKEPWLDKGFQDMILKLHLQREREAEKTGRERRFQDRGVPDMLVYYERMGLKPSEEMQREIAKALQRQYDRIFLIENVGICKKTQVRRENLTEALEIERQLEQRYRNLGYEPIRVPAMEVEKRAEMILKRI